MRNRLVAVLAVAVACVVVLPSPAFAKTYVGDAPDRREAAANYLGYGWGEQSTDLKNELGTVDDDWDYDRWNAWVNSLSWVTTPSLDLSSSTGYWETNYEGFMLVDARDKAKADFERALSRVASANESGGSGSDTPDTPDNPDSVAESYTIKSYFVKNNTTPTVGKITITAGVLTSMNNFASSNQKPYFIFMSTNKVPDYINTFAVYAFNNKPVVSYDSSTKRYSISVPSGTTFAYFSTVSNHRVYGNLSGSYDNFTFSTVKNNGPTSPSYNNITFVSDVLHFKLDSPSVPAVTPVNYTVNVYDNDTSNVTNDITNNQQVTNNQTTVYDSENNTYTTVNNYTTNNNVDVSAITQRLDSINSKVGQIGTDLNSLFGELNDNLRALFLGLGTTIDNGVNTLRNQLVQAVAWLQVIESDLHSIVRKLDSPVSTSGDIDLSSVTVLVDDVETQLSEISDRIAALANGGPSVPTITPPSNTEVPIGTQLGQKVEELSRRFPFSLPWDVQFVLSLLVRTPVAPEFDLPVFWGGGDDVVVHVDLSDWEPAAAACRQGTKLLFALGLALRSRQLVSSWGSSGD